MKLQMIFDEHSSDDVFNVLTKVVLPKTNADEFLDCVTIGEEMYKNFKQDRIIGEKSIWDKLSKRNLTTFASMNKVTKVQLKEKIVEIKEKKLMTRLILAPTKREDVRST